MNDTKLTKDCQRLAAKQCTNYYGGYCVWKDMECRAAPGSGLCRYFRESVLEWDPELTARVRAYLGKQAKSWKTCTACNRPFIPETARQIFCPECRRQRRREQTRQHVRDMRQKQKGGM